MGTVDFQDENRFERRIGRRVDVDPVPVTWVVPQGGRWGRKKPALELPGRIENVSITGAAIVGPAELELAAGARAVIRSGGRDSVVVVRHRTPIADTGTARFGIELPRASSVLRRQIQELLDPMLPTPPSERGGLGPRLGIRPRTGPDDSRLGLPLLDGSGYAPEVVGSDRGAAEAASVGAQPDPHIDAPGPTGDAAAGSDGVVLDLTDATLEAKGEPVVELSGPATELARALRDLQPILVERSVPAPPPGDSVGGAEPEPQESEHVADEPDHRPDEPEPVQTLAALDEPPAEPGATSDAPSEPIEPPHSVGRQVLDDVFRLMDD